MVYPEFRGVRRSSDKFSAEVGTQRTSPEAWRWYHWLRLYGTQEQVLAVEAAIIKANWGAFVTVARKYGRDPDGGAALRAVRRFDPRRGYQFSTYLWRVMGSQSAHDNDTDQRYQRWFVPWTPRQLGYVREPCPRNDYEGMVAAVLPALGWYSTLALLRVKGGVGLREAGDVMGMSSERVRQVQLDAAKQAKRLALVVEAGQCPKAAALRERIAAYRGAGRAGISAARFDELWKAAAACVAAQNEEGLGIIAELLAMPPTLREQFRRTP